MTHWVEPRRERPCGCCEPAAALTPLAVENRPALPAVGYRIGTYSSFRASMFHELAEWLPELRTRRPDDHGIALLELWSAVADVLTFYQERYANEAFLRTATRQESVARLARLIGYTPAPGAAALAWLAFTAERGKAVQVPLRQRVQSVPGQDERAQTFETIEKVAADARLNRVRVYPAPVASPHPLARGQAEVTLDRVQGPRLRGGLAAGDRVLVFRSGGTVPVEEKRVHEVRVEDDRVVVAWAEPIQGEWFAESPPARPALGGGGMPFELAEPRIPFVSEGLRAEGLRAEGLRAEDRLRLVEELGEDEPGGWRPIRRRKRRPRPRPGPESPVAGEAPQLFKLGRTFRLFGHAAPASFMKPDTDASVPGGIRWTLTASRDWGYDAGTTLQLDARYEQLAPGASLLVSEAGGRSTLVRVTQVSQAEARFDPLSDTVTHLELDRALPRLSDRRRVTIHELTGPELTLWSSRYPDALTGDTVYVPGQATPGGGIEIGRTVERDELVGGVEVRPDDVETGRAVIVLDEAGEPVFARVRERPEITPPDASGFCHLVLRLDLDAPLLLDARSAVLLGNVALASHGETVADEQIGSGDASLPYQRFALAKAPLTHVPSARAGGVESTLEVTVDGVRWRGVPSLYGRDPDERVYTARRTEDGGTLVQFGDGRSGARLSTGRGNVRATYRMGVGLEGRVRADTLTTLLARPPGLEGVTNPRPAEGGADPDGADAARRGAPRSVRTFGRAVSLRDFEDLVTESGEVAKAQATWVWDGLGRGVHVTVAGQGGQTFGEESLRRLGASLTAARDPNHRLTVVNYVPAPIEIEATIDVEPDRVRDQVLAAARDALLAAVSFDALALGQPLHLSDLVRAVQDVPGVLAVDVDELRFKHEPTPDRQVSRPRVRGRRKPPAAERLRSGPAPAGTGPVLRPRLPEGLFLRPELLRPELLRPPVFRRPPMRLLQPRLRAHLPVRPARPDPAQTGRALPAELAVVETPGQDVVLHARGGLEA